MKDVRSFFGISVLLFFLLTFSSQCLAQVGYDSNNLYSASNGNGNGPGNDNGNHNGHNNPNNPNYQSPSVPIDDHIWILILGAGGLFWYYSRKSKKYSV